jgi:hypothetical protein
VKKSKPNNKYIIYKCFDTNGKAELKVIWGEETSNQANNAADRGQPIFSHQHGLEVFFSMHMEHNIDLLKRKFRKKKDMA